MRSWWIAQKLSRKWFQKKKTPGPGTRLERQRCLWRALSMVGVARCCMTSYDMLTQHATQIIWPEGETWLVFCLKTYLT